jgi:hypothetical protein
VPKESDPINWRFRSQWIDMGLPYLKKYPKYLYIYGISTGNHDVVVQHYKNRDWTDAFAGGTARGQVADQKDQDVYDFSKWDTAKWQDKRLIQVRVPITTSSVSEYAFEIAGFEPFMLVGYSVEYQADGAMTIKGKTN